MRVYLHWLAWKIRSHIGPTHGHIEICPLPVCYMHERSCDRGRLQLGCVRMNDWKMSKPMSSPSGTNMTSLQYAQFESSLCGM